MRPPWLRGPLPLPESGNGKCPPFSKFISRFRFHFHVIPRWFSMWFSRYAKNTWDFAMWSLGDQIIKELLMCWWVSLEYTILEANSRLAHSRLMDGLVGWLVDWYVNEECITYTVYPYGVYIYILNLYPTNQLKWPYKKNLHPWKFNIHTQNQYICFCQELPLPNTTFLFEEIFSISWVVPPPRIPVANEGLGWDPLLKI